MISAIVLAAGKSERMGEQKLLLPLGEGTVISRIVDEVMASPVDEVLVVAGGERERIERALEGRQVRFVDNPDADGDMLSSVRCALIDICIANKQATQASALQNRASVVSPPCNGNAGLDNAIHKTDAVLAVLGDQPSISRSVVAELIQAFEAEAGRIVVPTFQGRRGHPLLFSASYREEILHGFDDVGLRGLLQAHPESVCEVEVFSPAVLENMNLPSDYRRIREK